MRKLSVSVERVLKQILSIMWEQENAKGEILVPYGQGSNRYTSEVCVLVKESLETFGFPKGKKEIEATGNYLCGVWWLLSLVFDCRVI